MLGVTIHINGQVIYARTAVDRGPVAARDDPAHEFDIHRYETDTGEEVLHDPGDGAVVLAKLLLDTIREQG